MRGVLRRRVVGETALENGDDRRGNRRPRVRRDDEQDQPRTKPRARKSRDGSDGDGTDFEPSENPFTRKDEEDEKPKKRRAPRKAQKRDEGEQGGDGEIDAAALPPAIGSNDDDGAAKPAPRRRRRKADESEAETAVG